MRAQRGRGGEGGGVKKIVILRVCARQKEIKNDQDFFFFEGWSGQQ